MAEQDITINQMPPKGTLFGSDNLPLMDVDDVTWHASLTQLANFVSANLPNVGIAGTYTKVTTDAQGRVVAGANLTAGDIPSLLSTKISNFNSAVTTVALSKSNNLSDLANITTAVANLGLTPGVNVQAYSDALASIAGLTTAANKMIYTTAANTYDVTDLTSFARSLLAGADAATVRSTLGLSNTDNIAEGTNLYYTNARVDGRIMLQKGVANGLATLDGSGKVPASQLPSLTGNVSSVFGRQGDVVAQSGDYTTALVTESGNLYFTNDRADARIALQKAVANGLATLGVDGKIPTSQLPSLAVTDVFEVSSEAAMLALDAHQGDFAIRTDINTTFILATNDPTVLENWKDLEFAVPVSSVNGKTGVVTLTTSDISEGTNLYYTQARFDSAFSAKTTSNLTEGSNLYFTNPRALSAIGKVNNADGFQISGGTTNRTLYVSNTDIVLDQDLSTTSSPTFNRAEFASDILISGLIAARLSTGLTDQGILIWDDASTSLKTTSLTGYLLAANNLSDLANAATARTNLGLGTMATQNTTSYYTASQLTNASLALSLSSLTLGLGGSGGIIHGRVDQNSSTSFVVQNNTPAAASYASMRAASDASYIEILALSSAYASTGPLVAGATVLRGSGSVGLNVVAENVGFYTGASNTFAGIFTSSQTFGVGVSSPVSLVHLGKNAAPTTLAAANEYLHIGGTESATNSYRGMGFGGLGGGSFSPAMIVYQEIDASSYTYGNLNFHVRGGAFNSAAPKVLSLTYGYSAGLGANVPDLPRAILHIGATNAVTSMDYTSSYLHLGGSESALNSFRLLGFGPMGATTSNPPAFFGFKQTSATGSSKGELIAGTRNVTTDTQASIAWRIKEDGCVIKPLQPCFSAYRATDISNATGDGTDITVTGWTETVDQGSNFNATTGVFTAPQTGCYFFSASVTMGGLSSSHTGAFIVLATSTKSYLLESNNIYANNPTVGSFSNLTDMGNSVVVFMNAGDTATLVVTVAGGSKTVSISGSTTGITYFTGALLF